MAVHLYFLIDYTSSLVITDPCLPLSLLLADRLTHIFTRSSDDGEEPSCTWSGQDDG